MNISRGVTPKGSGEQPLAYLGYFLGFQIAAGGIYWGLKSYHSMFVFALGALMSIFMWILQKQLLNLALATNYKRQWIFGLLYIFKLLLIIWSVRAIMIWSPNERISLACGLLIFPASLLLEAGRMILFHRSSRV